jgi:hypothetical protein
MKKRCCFVVALAWCLPALLAAQSPWVRSKAGAYAQLSYNFIPTYTTLFGEGNGDIALPREVSEATAQLYGEYGLTRRATLVAALPLRILRAEPVASSSAVAQKTSGLGNASLALRYSILKGDLPLTGALRVDFPAPKTTLRTGFETFTLLPMLSTGKGWRWGYAFAYGGYALRGGGFSDYLNAGAEGGVRLGKFWLAAFTELVRPLENGDVALPPESNFTGLSLDNQGWWSFGTKFIYEHSRFWGFTASAAGAGWGQLVPKSPGIGVGAFFKWD